MILHNGSIALNWEDLMRGGISENTLKSASYRNSEAWPFFQLGNRLHILWNDIRDNYRTLIENNIGNPYNAMAAQVIMPHVVCKHTDREFLQNYTDEDGRSLTFEKQQQYMQACAFLNLLDGMTKPKYQAMGYPRRASFDEAISSLIKSNNVKLPTATCKLIVKLQAYRQQGPIAIIDGRTGNQNTRVFTEEQQRWLMAAYADHRKPTVEMVYNIYLRHAKERGWKAASISTVKAFIAKKSTRHIVEIERDPKIWKDKFGYSINTQKPTFANALWEGDGTKNNLSYIDSKGKLRADLQVYLVSDVASEVFLGVAFGFSEKKEVAINAWRMAVLYSGTLPYQSRTDGGGAHKSSEMRQFLADNSNVFWKAMAHNGQSKYIEGIIGRFQSQNMRLFDNFTGMNITSKKDDSRVNSAWIKDNTHKIPDLRGSMEQAVRAIEAWNYGKNKKGQVRMDLYKQSQSAGRAITNNDNIILLYDWRKDNATYRKNGITITEKKVDYTYQVYNNDMPCLDFMIDNVNQEFRIKYRKDDMSHIYLMDTKENRIIARADSATRVPGAAFDYTEGSRTLINKHLNLKKEQIHTLREMIDELKAENLIEMSHEDYHKDALLRADSDYFSYTVEESAPLPKAPKQIAINKKDPMLPEGFEEGGELTINE